MLHYEDPVKELRKTKIVFIFFIVGAIIIYVYHRVYYASLVRNFIVTNGRIIKLTNLAKSTPSAVFTYSIGKKTYTGSETHPDFENFSDRYVLIERYFPVIVDSTDYTNKKMLFVPSDFEEFGLNYPDSLRWLNEYLE